MMPCCSTVCVRNHKDSIKRVQHELKAQKENEMTAEYSFTHPHDLYNLFFEVLKDYSSMHLICLGGGLILYNFALAVTLIPWMSPKDLFICHIVSLGFVCAVYITNVIYTACILTSIETWFLETIVKDYVYDIQWVRRSSEYIPSTRVIHKDDFEININLALTEYYEVVHRIALIFCIVPLIESLLIVMSLSLKDIPEQFTEEETNTNFVFLLVACTSFSGLIRVYTEEISKLWDIKTSRFNKEVIEKLSSLTWGGGLNMMFRFKKHSVSSSIV
jgi:hypothetical protein